MTAAAEAAGFDVVIAGGGPAGAAAGLALLKRPGTRVAIVEATGYEPPRLGESLTPGVRPLLEYLDLWEPFRRCQSIEAFGSVAAWGSPALGALDYMFTLHGTGWNLDRCAFDRLLAEAFRKRGGRLLAGARVVGCDRAGDGTWRLHLRDAAHGDRVLSCRYLIDATGRAGMLARRLGALRRRHDRLVGIARFGRLPDAATVRQVTLVEAREYGWWYSAPIPDGRIAVVLMTDADIARRLAAARVDRWEALLAMTDATRERADGVAFTDRPVARPAGSGCLDRPGGRGWVAVGDAAASHDPLSSSGIPNALGSGVQGAVVAAAVLAGTEAALDAYRDGIDAEFRRYLETRWRYYRREARWPDAPFWRRRREEIGIDPAAGVGGGAHPGSPVANAPRASEQVGGIHLEPHLARDLLALCRPGRAAHAIVRAFADAHPEVPDERIILGLQELVRDRRVSLVPAGPETPRGPALAGPLASYRRPGQDFGAVSPTST